MLLYDVKVANYRSDIRASPSFLLLRYYGEDSWL